MRVSPKIALKTVGHLLDAEKDGESLINRYKMEVALENIRNTLPSISRDEFYDVYKRLKHPDGQEVQHGMGKKSSTKRSTKKRSSKKRSVKRSIKKRSIKKRSTTKRSTKKRSTKKRSHKRSTKRSAKRSTKKRKSKQTEREFDAYLRK